MKTLKEALEGLLWLIDQGQLIENEPSVCAPSLVNDARGALIESITAERLAKIEVLELANQMFLDLDEMNPVDYSDSFDVINTLLEELKAGN